ncbi:flavohemoprotein [Halobacillus andaensis]|uniref:Flavohemoprotein n=1 Tax=Halobacillus andaensis TaxID=1176239 RepID=A0A917EX18_HALAA|nr:NO-inducible flavohemoprotein [Halobacillus andaensis]MBP2004949.1 nitric oxide dioxygenase [Halobacillus andaensis]GGF17658.1 flavohemoprotein [Halobacillus andaensis]
MATQLSEKTIQTVKSTVPVLAEHGEAITTHFYQRMFADHPELKNIFNMTNQKAGRQPRALANAVYAAAQHIDNLEAILPTVDQIAEKHRSLNVKPEHYPIVGEYLLVAIKEVLGDAATDDIIEAWGEAYGAIADVFIQVEQEKYNKAKEQEGGWLGYRDFTVVKKVKESDVITSFYLEPKDGGIIPPFRPGQYITAQVSLPDSEYTQLRQYSLSDAPGKGYYRISVKREDGSEEQPDGVVSTFLHEQVNEGDILPITAPAGEFYLNEESTNPVVFISGGVGLTPMMSMLNRLVDQDSDRDVYFVHASQNGEVHAFKGDIAQFEEQASSVQSKVVYSDPHPSDADYDKKGHIDLEWLKAVVPYDAEFYFCGPEGFMRTVNAALNDWGVPEGQVHYEFFGPELSLQ